MMSLMRLGFATLFTVTSSVALQEGDGLRVGSNPIRKVVNLLENIKAKVEAEGEKEEAMFTKFKCYCKNSGGSMSKEVEEAQKQIPELESEIKSFSGEKEQVQSSLADNEESEAEAKKSLGKAKTVYEKEHEHAVEEIKNDEINIKALNGALKSSHSAGFLQSDAARVLRRMAATRSDIADESRSTMLAFLAGQRSDAEEEDVGNVQGVLAGIKSSIVKDETSVIKADKVEKKDFVDIQHAKKKEMHSLEEQIRTKTERAGNLAVTIAKDESRLEDYKEGLAEDQQLLARLGQICDEKLKEFEENARLRGVELKALAETIKMLSSDDALELLKKALPGSSASLLQLSTSTASLKSRARSILLAHASPSARLDLIALAMQGKKLGLDKVLKMIDDMKVTLEKEQKDDEEKKAFCEKEFDETEDDTKQKHVEKSDLTAAIEEGKEELAALEESIKAAQVAVAENDKAAKDASEQRKEEHEEFKELVSTNAAAKELLTRAKDRMAKFYNSQEAGAFTQLSSSTHRTTELREAPATAKEFSGNAGGSTVISAIATIIADLEKETTVAKTEEENAQEDYEQMTKKSATKRAADEKTIADGTAQRADLKSQLESHMKAKKNVGEDIQGLDKYMASLHVDCDFILKFFETRAQARKDEIDGLIKARAVLANAD